METDPGHRPAAKLMRLRVPAPLRERLERVVDLERRHPRSTSRVNPHRVALDAIFRGLDLLEAEAVARAARAAEERAA